MSCKHKKEYNLNQMESLTTQELGELFPIEIVPYNNKWKEIFANERKLIQNTLGENIALRIEHFGSTAVEGLSAKPTIDMLIEIPQLTKELTERVIEKMREIGYHFMWRTDESTPYMHFVKGYTLKGFEGNIFHIHMGDKTHSLWDRIFFRDFLRNNPTTAKEYEKLKISLAKKYQFDREAYTNGKGEFVKRITEIAKKIKP